MTARRSQDRLAALTVRLVRTARSVRRSSRAAAGRVARAAGPVLRRTSVHAARQTLRTLRAAARQARRHRAILRTVTERLAWWAALGLLVLGGRPVLGEGPLPERWLALAPFALGLLLCAALRLGSRARSLRMAALWLGALHGTAIVLVWTAFAG